MLLPEFKFSLPAWLIDFIDRSPQIFSSIDDRMDFAIELSRKNIDHGGGPFGAAIFDGKGRLIAPGVNLVMPENCAILHAEITAILLAQKAIGRFDLSDGGTSAHDLYATTEPCAMCYGAVIWSGVSRLVCGARKQDAEAIGFDEGPKPENWIAELEARGIHVITDVRREQATAVLRDYVKQGGIIYNSRIIRE